MIYTFDADDPWPLDLLTAIDHDGCVNGDKLHFVLPDGRIVRTRIEAIFADRAEYDTFRKQRTDEGRADTWLGR